MLSTARYQMYPILKKLWDTSFGDGEAYTNFLLDKIPPEQILVWLDGKTIAAMLCWLPFEMKSSNGNVSAVYMFGFNVHPRFRGKGIGTKLLEGFHQYIFGKGYRAACLAPADMDLFDYYDKRGYELLFSVKSAVVSAADIPKSENNRCVLVPRPLNSLYAERERFFGGEGMFASWGKNTLDLFGSECRFRKGQTLKVSCCGKGGYVALLPVGNGKIRINELAVPPEIMCDVLHALNIRLGVSEFELRLRADERVPFVATVLPFVMVKWYDREKQIDIFKELDRLPYFAHILD